MGFKVRLPLIEHFVENCNNFIETGNIPAFKDVRHKGLERREGSPNAPGPACRWEPEAPAGEHLPGTPASVRAAVGDQCHLPPRSAREEAHGEH